MTDISHELGALNVDGLKSDDLGLIATAEACTSDLVFPFVRDLEGENRERIGTYAHTVWSRFMGGVMIASFREAGIITDDTDLSRLPDAMREVVKRSINED